MELVQSGQLVDLETDFKYNQLWVKFKERDISSPGLRPLRDKSLFKMKTSKNKRVKTRSRWIEQSELAWRALIVLKVKTSVKSGSITLPFTTIFMFKDFGLMQMNIFFFCTKSLKSEPTVGCSSSLWSRGHDLTCFTRVKHLTSDGFRTELALRRPRTGLFAGSAGSQTFTPSMIYNSPAQGGPPIRSGIKPQSFAEREHQVSERSEVREQRANRGAYQSLGRCLVNSGYRQWGTGLYVV